MSSACLYQSCFYNCCSNQFGTCATSASACVYYTQDYYSVYALAWWIWTLIGVGIFLFVVCIIGIIVCCCRACRNSSQEVIIDNNANMGYNYGNNTVSAAYGGSPGTYNNQVYLGQPVGGNVGNMEMKQF